jgi:hypothetical protein
MSTADSGNQRYSVVELGIGIPHVKYIAPEYQFNPLPCASVLRLGDFVSGRVSGGSNEMSNGPLGQEKRFLI